MNALRVSLIKFCYASVMQKITLHLTGISIRNKYKYDEIAGASNEDK